MSDLIDRRPDETQVIVLKSKVMDLLIENLSQQEMLDLFVAFDSGDDLYEELGEHAQKIAPQFFANANEDLDYEDSTDGRLK